MAIYSQFESGTVGDVVFHITVVSSKDLGSKLKNFQSREPLPGCPQFVVPANSEHDTQRGDHIVFQVTEPPFRVKFRSALVVQPGEYMEIIMNSEEGVVKKLVPFHLLNRMHKIIYTSCLYDEQRAVERAEFRLKHREQCYHVLKNNSHFFVTWCITGREYSLTDILRTLESLSCKQKQ